MARESTPRGISLHIGLNSVSPKHYDGWTGPLTACEFDARDMAAIAKAQGMKTKVLLTSAGTRKRTLNAIRDAAKKLDAGDLFFLTYSGHGGQLPDATSDEPDKTDETWCLFDGELLDDELNLELSAFAPGVRVLVLSDSCHSGTVVRAPASAGGDDPSLTPRAMPNDVAVRTYEKHRELYDKLRSDVRKRGGTKAAKGFKPSLILISGCQDNQLSMDGDNNGAFTGRLLEVWAAGAFTGSYRKFHAAIEAAMPASQRPNFFTLGKAAKFAAEKPFSV